MYINQSKYLNNKTIIFLSTHIVHKNGIIFQFITKQKVNISVSMKIKLTILWQYYILKVEVTRILFRYVQLRN